LLALLLAEANPKDVRSQKIYKKASGNYNKCNYHIKRYGSPFVLTSAFALAFALALAFAFALPSFLHE
jgi:hypothetical protein